MKQEKYRLTKLTLWADLKEVLIKQENWDLIWKSWFKIKSEDIQAKIENWEIELVKFQFPLMKYKLEHFDKTTWKEYDMLSKIFLNWLAILFNFFAITLMTYAVFFLILFTAKLLENLVFWFFWENWFNILLFVAFIISYFFYDITKDEAIKNKKEQLKLFDDKLHS